MQGLNFYSCFHLNGVQCFLLTTTIGSHTLAPVPDNVKRHVAVGIAFNNVLVPELRAVIDGRLENLYKSLVRNHKINTNNNDLMNPRQRYGFSYRDPDNDFVVSSHHELAKLFIDARMVKFNRITDPYFDGSAALNILERASCFSKNEKRIAREIRENLRNPWAHCNIDEWDDRRFLESFKLMEELVTALSKAQTPKTMAKSFDAGKLTNHLKAWKVDGLKLMGKNVDPALLSRVFEEHEKVMKTLVEENVKIENFKDQQKIIQEAVRKVQEKQGVFESEQITMKQSISDNSERITELESKFQKRHTPLFSQPTRNPCFTGRESHLQMIRKALHEDSCPVVTIQGLGGLGKTTLALEAAWKEKENFPGGIYWLTADSDSGDRVLEASIFGLARRMEGIPPNIDADRMVDIITSNLIDQKKRSLLVIDNLDSEDFSPLVDRLINGSWVQDDGAAVAMLITSRLGKHGKVDLLEENIGRKSLNIHLGSFSLEEGVQFLGRRTALSFEELDAKDLVNTLDGLPLALDQAAAYIKRYKCELAEYLKELEAAKLEILNEMKAHNVMDRMDKDRLRVQTTWRTNMNAIREEVPEAEKLSHVLAFLSPRCIPISIINEGAPRLADESMAKTLSVKFKVKKILLVLKKMSLFEEASEDSIRVHRMVQEIIKDDVEKKEILEPTLENAQKMLSKAVDIEESPSKYLELDDKDIKWSIETLGGWSMVMENVGHFMEELKTLKVVLKTEPNCTAKLLDHAYLYYFVLNQTDRAVAYRQQMDEHLAKAQGEKMYKPQFPFPFQRASEKKEVLGRLMEPRTNEVEDNDERLKEVRAQESKEKGDRFAGEKKYQQALEWYNTALENTSSADLRQRVSLNRCSMLYRLEKNDSCVEQAERVLQRTPQNPTAYLWMALAYSKMEKEVRDKDPDEVSKQEKLEGELFQELSLVYAGLSLHWARDEKDKIEKMLERHKLALFKTRVLEVDSEGSLANAVRFVSVLRSQGSHAEKHIILVKEGTYRMGLFFWQSVQHMWIAGDLSGQKPVFHVDSYHPMFIRRNVFINFHFKLNIAQMTVRLVEDPLLFLHCSFESTYGVQRQKLSSDQEALELHEFERMRLDQLKNCGSPEEREQRKLTDSERSLYKAYEDKKLQGNAPSALVVLQGRCALVKCEIKYCDGAGVLVSEEPVTTSSVTTIAPLDNDPYLYMRGSTVMNCGFSGVEAREQGSMFLENCTFSNNREAGVLAWRNANMVAIRGCAIFANKGEGVHVADGNESYDNSIKLVLKDTHVHHNQIGISLEWVRSILIQSCKVFSNRSWGIYMRNTNVAIVRDNDVFRNDCGGVRVCFNRFGHTVVMKNLIHDHTGPDFIQTLFKSEGEQETMPIKFDREANRVPVLMMDNLCYNNDLSYGSIADWRVFLEERNCGFCSKEEAQILCKRCNKVFYCNNQCQARHVQDHKTFCDYFVETNVVELSFTHEKLERRNRLIEDRTAKRHKSDYKGKEFLIKITAGDDGFGLDRSTDTRGLGMGKNAEPGTLFIYDEFRFISGITKCPKLHDIVRQFGKLSGEKVSNRRIYLYARLLFGPRPVWKLSVRIDKLFHEQGW